MISIAITVCNEHQELETLLDYLQERALSPKYEIVVQIDQDNHTQEVVGVILDRGIKHWFFPLNKDFDAWKNKLNSLCSKDFIFQIDADETPDRTMIENLPALLKEQFGRIDLLLVPRINTVKGLSDEHIQKWRWKIDKHFGFECVNFPDFQTRIYRNDPSIKWHGKVHERITGVDKYAYLPTNVVDWCLYHHKTIERQQKQNDYYSNL